MRLAFSFKVLMFWKPIQKRKKLKDLHTVLDKMLAFTFYEAATCDDDDVPSQTCWKRINETTAIGPIPRR